MLPRPLATAIIVVVTIVWAVNFAAQFVVDNYSPDVAINGIFMAVVGGAIALSRKDSKSVPPPDSKEEDPEPAKVE
jgi:hypothetical protein